MSDPGSTDGFLWLALEGGPPVGAGWLAPGTDASQLAALADAVRRDAGLAAVPVARPLVGLALALPAGADALLVARAIDAERVTAGYLDLDGRACVALPADPSAHALVAHAVAKVAHLLLEVHTPHIEAHAAACAEAPPAAGDGVDALGEAAQLLVDALAACDLHRVPPEARAHVCALLARVAAELGALAAAEGWPWRP